MQNIFISPSQASRLFGVSERSIRRAIADGYLNYTIEKERYKLDFLDLLKWSEQKPGRSQKRDEIGIGQYVEKWHIPSEDKLKKE